VGPQDRGACVLEGHLVDKFDGTKFTCFTIVLIRNSSLLFGFIGVNVMNEVSNMFNTYRKFSLFFILTALTACGGGGGGGSPVITTTSINNATFDSTTGFRSVTALSALTNTSTSTTNTSTLTYSGSTITKAVVVGPDGNLITFDTNLGDVISTYTTGGVTLVGAVKQNQQEQILIANFQNSTKSKIVNHNKIIGSKMYHSVSLQANKSSVDPTATTATYSGELLGSYSSIGAFHAVNGKPMITNADVSMTANFATDSIAFSTSNTVGKQLPSLGSNISLSSLDMTGTLTDPDNNNSFTGNVTTSGAHTGSVTALVIGDSAEELSGFGSTSTTNEIHSFGFITKK